MNTDTKKIISRVQKLLAMANDAGSPREAEIAARRARSLMDDHQLNLEDLKERSQFNTVEVGTSRRFIAEWEQSLAIGIAKFNDCIVDKNKSGNTENGSMYKIRFKGFDEDVKICEYLFGYLTLVAKNTCSLYLKGEGYDRYNARLGTAFKRGFAREMQERFKLLAEKRKAKFSKSTDLVVIKNQLVTEHFGLARYKKSSSVDLDYESNCAFVKGRDEAKKTKIHDGVESNSHGTKGISK